MKQLYEDKIVRDSNGRIILESRADGFIEETTYDEDTGQITKIDTIYSNGIREVEQFAIKK